MINSIKKILAITCFITGCVNASADNTVVEWAPFTVKTDVTDTQVIHAAQAVEEHFLAQQKGFIKRTLLKGKNNQWADIVYWQSEKDAETAMQNAAASTICNSYFALMVTPEDSSLSPVQHFTVAKNWQ